MSDQSDITKKKNISDNTYAVMVSFAGTVGMTDIMAVVGNSITYTNSFFAFIVFGLSVYVLSHICPSFRCSIKRNKFFSYISSILLSFALHMGASLESTANVNFKDIRFYLFSVLLAVYFAPIISWLWKAASDCISRLSVKKNDEKALDFRQIWAVIFILWLPVFFAMYPGAFVYDATEEYIQVISRSFSMHHPLFHVLMLGGIVHLAEYLGLGANLGIAVYTILQMIVFSAVLAYAVFRLAKKGLNKKFQLAVILFFGLFPVFPMYAVCSAKDTLFTASVLVVVMLLIDHMEDAGEFYAKKRVLFVIASVFVMLFRNNGVYAYVIAILVIAVIGLCVRFDRKNLARLMVLMLLSVVLYKGTDYCLKLATHATGGEYQEKLTVPIQQLARVYKYAPETFSDEERKQLYEILPEDYLITYNPRISDVLKSGFNNEAYAKDKEKYNSLWFHIGMRKPYIYLNAWLVNSYGYWYPDMIINVYGGNQMYTFMYKDSSYFGFETEPPGERHSLFPLLERFYRNISLELYQQKVPVISMLFAPGFVFILFAGHLLGLMKDKKWITVAAYSPVWLLWATVLLGPTVLVRYVLILWCILPVMLCDRPEKIKV